ncbi:hypothetical protein ATO6_02490 [Oceanicola sp. 22II-s10i]|uniref:DUF4139 domain-containing protein n=1 Tax=Oceanicola sp. 22II-s10i TaxID=1317116 RepID=UPI000B5244EB|nr:DUF4139 domain-containing protein [Oceanicola sp. 22II-s10i]OWU85797.1 hypothetical protein ATO6_02490 [Oceanicola sp. 22II-s10i]
MRAALILPLLLPFPALADDITIPSRITGATVFPSGAALTRVATFNAPAGQHRLILGDMPVMDVSGLRIEADGVTLGSVTIRDDMTPPRDPAKAAEIEAAEAEVERLEQALEEARDDAQSIRAEAQAARAQIEFLKQVASSDGVLSAGIDALRDLSRMVAAETLTAERQALQAEARAREAEQAAKTIVEDLARAKQALAALDTEDERRAYLAINVNVPEAVSGELTLRYVTGAAQWRPVYDIHLDHGADSSLSIGRGAYVSQWTGENWQDVAMTLSTVRPSGQTQPGELYPIQRRIVDPEDLARASKRYSAAGAADSAEAAPAPEPVMMEEARAQYDGLSVTYSYNQPVTLATDADELRIALGTVTADPELVARAVPIMDETAYLMASFTNGADEIILPSDQSEFYLNGTFVGLRPTPLIAAGDEAEFSFGPIEGLRLKRTLLNRMEGDRGVISRSNEQEERVEIEIRNLTGEAWEVELIDQVPFTEQEDLEIDWTASPMPTRTDVDGKRGILAWDLEMAAGETKVVNLDLSLNWPRDKVLAPNMLR